MRRTQYVTCYLLISQNYIPQHSLLSSYSPASVGSDCNVVVLFYLIVVASIFIDIRPPSVLRFVRQILLSLSRFLSVLHPFSQSFSPSAVLTFVLNFVRIMWGEREDERIGEEQNDSLMMYLCWGTLELNVFFCAKVLRRLSCYFTDTVQMFLH